MGSIKDLNVDEETINIKKLGKETLVYDITAKSGHHVGNINPLVPEFFFS